MSVLPKRQFLPPVCKQCKGKPGPNVTFEYVPTKRSGCWDRCDACRISDPKRKKAA